MRKHVGATYTVVAWPDGLAIEHEGALLGLPNLVAAHKRQLRVLQPQSISQICS
jgi:hypothetical protein